MLMLQYCALYVKQVVSMQVCKFFIALAQAIIFDTLRCPGYLIDLMLYYTMR